MKETYSPQDIGFLRKTILRWGSENLDKFPWRDTNNKWHALVAEVMLQRTKAEQVEEVYKSFCERYPNPEDYLADPDPRIFSRLGLYWREKQLRLLVESIQESGIPRDKQDLMGLAGIGNYISAAFRSLHLGIHDVIIDSNVVRIYGRYFGFSTDGETRRKKWLKNLAEEITPRWKFKDFNYGLIDFTRRVCKTSPACEGCPLNERCMYGKQRVIL